MCELATIGIIASAVSAVGTVMSFVGSSDQASAQQEMANQQAAIAAQNAENSRQISEYNAAVTRNNATAAQQQATDAIVQGNKAAQDHLKKAAALKGTQTASMAARGLDLSEGSAASILSDTDLFAELDTLTIKDNAAKLSWAKKMDAYNFDATAKGIDMSGNADYQNKMAEASLYKAKGASINPFMSGTSSLISGAGSVADKWYQYSKVSGSSTDSSGWSSNNYSG